MHVKLCRLEASSTAVNLNLSSSHEKDSNFVSKNLSGGSTTADAPGVNVTPLSAFKGPLSSKVRVCYSFLHSPIPFFLGSTE